MDLCLRMLRRRCYYRNNYSIHFITFSSFLDKNVWFFIKLIWNSENHKSSPKVQSKMWVLSDRKRLYGPMILCFTLEKGRGDLFKVSNLKEPLPLSRKIFFWVEVFFETSPYERAESALSNDTKLYNFWYQKKLKQSIWKYMGSYWSSTFTMYFQIDYLNFFWYRKLISLVSLERTDSALSYGEVSEKTSSQEKKNRP